MDAEKNFFAAEYLERRGGGFASALAVAWFRADLNNRRRIESVFQDLFDYGYEQYQQTKKD